MKSEHMNKYRARKTIIHGIQFDSKRESQEYLKLLSMEQAGEIHGLERLERGKDSYIVLDKIKGERARYYTPDFRYVDNKGRTVVVEVKGKAARDYTLKRHLFKLRYPDIVFVEVR